MELACLPNFFGLLLCDLFVYVGENVVQDGSEPQTRKFNKHGKQQHIEKTKN